VISSRTGIRERRVCRPDQATSDLAVRRRRPARYQRPSREDIDLVISTSLVPDMLFPPRRR